MDTVVHAWQSIPHSFWVALGASGIISVVLQFIKHWLEELSPKVLMTLLTTFSFGAAAINYLLGNASTNPTLLGQQTASLVGLATILYRFVIGPGTKLMVDAKAERARQDALKAATPAVPGATTTVSVTNAPATSGAEANF